MPILVEVKIYSRADCHLYEETKRTVERVAQEVELTVTIEEVDVEGEDETLRAEYGDRVPHVFVDGWPRIQIRSRRRGTASAVTAIDILPAKSARIPPLGVRLPTHRGNLRVCAHFFGTFVRAWFPRPVVVVPLESHGPCHRPDFAIAVFPKERL